MDTRNQTTRSTTNAIPGSPPRRGRTAHQLTVTQVQRLVPRVVSITLRGESLANFSPPNPGGHIKIAFDLPDGRGQTMRTYTPRRFDPDRLELDVEFVLHSLRDLDITWLHSAGNAAEPGALLHSAVKDLPVGLDADWFVATEAGAMRRIRDHLRSDRQVAPERLQTRGYWRSGETNYPDHDYGETTETAEDSR